MSLPVSSMNGGDMAAASRFGTRIKRTAAALALVLAMGTACAAAEASSPEKTSAELLAKLQETIGQTPTGERLQTAQTLGQVKRMLSLGRPNEAEQYLMTARSYVMNDKALSALIDQLLESMREQTTAVEVRRNAELDAILSETAAVMARSPKAADFDPLLKRLAAVPVNASYNDPGVQRVEIVRNFLARAQDYFSQVEQGLPDSGALNEMVQLSSRLPIIPRSQLLALQAKNAKNPAPASSPEGDDLKKQVVALIDRAKTAADFDAIVQELVPARVPQRNSTVANQMETLRRYVLRWQEYYSQLEAGNPGQAQSILRDLSNDTNTESYYPRSRMLARINGKAPAAAPLPEELITPEALTLENLDVLVRQLAARQLRNTSSYDPAQQSVMAVADRLRVAYNQVKLGNPQATMRMPQNTEPSVRTEPYTLVFTRLHLELLMQALPLAINPPASLKPQPNEQPDAYLLRVVQGGKEKKDWQLVYRAIEAAQTLSTWSTARLNTNEASAYSQFFAGMNQERAGQWSMAVQSYLGALRVASPYIPAEEIGERLKRLKAEHPSDYEQAIKPVVTTYEGMRPPGYPANFYPDGPQTGARGPATPSSATPVPGSLPKPPAEAAAKPAESAAVPKAEAPKLEAPKAAPTPPTEPAKVP